MVSPESNLFVFRLLFEPQNITNTFCTFKVVVNLTDYLIRVSDVINKALENREDVKIKME